MSATFSPRWPIAIDVIGLGAAVVALWAFQDLPRRESPAALQLFLTGVFLLAGLFAGHLTGRIGVPRITGCIVFGIALNPTFAALFASTPLAFDPIVTTAQAQALRPINDLAVGLIALMAGAEIRLSALRERLRAVLAIAALQGALVTIAVAVLVMSLSSILPVHFLDAALAGGEIGWPVALLAGSILAANSPTVVVSILKELRATGPLATTVMGVSVVMDAIVILAFTMLVAVVASTGVVETGAAGRSVMWVGGELIFAIVVSIAIGLGIGLLLRRYTDRSDYRLGYTLVGIALIIASIASAFGIKPLLCLLAAGFACENLGTDRSPRSSHRLEDALRRVSQPVFIVFFVAAGLNMDLVALQQTWYLMLILSVARIACVWIAARIGATATASPEVVKHYAWIGLLSQAGVTLALAQLVQARFPAWGGALANLVVGMVAMHQLIAPVALSWSLKRAGEVARQS